MAQNYLGTYSAARVSIVVAGFAISGYADGTFVTIEESGDGVMMKSGADGEVARSISNNYVVDINITLLQSSASNDILNNLYNVDRLTIGGQVFPIVIESHGGTTMYTSGQCWIRKRSRVSYARDIESREWSLQSISPNLAGFVSGSN